MHSCTQRGDRRRTLFHYKGPNLFCFPDCKTAEQELFPPVQIPRLLSLKAMVGERAPVQAREDGAEQEEAEEDLALDVANIDAPPAPSRRGLWLTCALLIFAVVTLAYVMNDYLLVKGSVGALNARLDAMAAASTPGEPTPSATLGAMSGGSDAKPTLVVAAKTTSLFEAVAPAVPGSAAKIAVGNESARSVAPPPLAPTQLPPVTQAPTALSGAPTRAPAAAVEGGWDRHLSSGFKPPNKGNLGSFQVWSCHRGESRCGRTATELYQGMLTYTATHPDIIAVSCAINWGCQGFSARVPTEWFFESPAFGTWTTYLKRGTKLSVLNAPTPPPTKAPTPVALHAPTKGIGVTPEGAPIARMIHVEAYSWSTVDATTVSAAWQARHPEWEVVLWTDADATVLTEQYFPRMLAKYAKLTGAARAPMLRWMVLFLKGGVFAVGPCMVSFDQFYAANPGAIFVGGTQSAPNWAGVVASRDRGNPLWTQLMAAPTMVLPQPSAVDPTAAVHVVAPTALAPAQPVTYTASVPPRALSAGILVSSGCPRRREVQSSLDKMRSLLASGSAVGPADAPFVVVSLSAGPLQVSAIQAASWKFLTWYQTRHPQVRVVQIRFDVLDPNRTPMWDKVMVLRAMLERHQRVLWIDSDIVSTKSNVDLEQLVTPHLVATSMVAVSDDVDIVNTGFVAVHRTLSSLQLLEYWWAIGWSRDGAKSEATTLNPGFDTFVMDKLNQAKFKDSSIDLFHRCWLQKRYDEQGCLTWLFDDYRALFPLATSITVIPQTEIVGFPFSGKCSNGEPLVHFCCMPAEEKAQRYSACLTTMLGGGTCRY